MLTALRKLTVCYRFLMFMKNELISELKKTNFKTFSLQGKVDIWKTCISTKTVRVSPAGNRTPVSRVTGGDTHHYTTEDVATYVV